jgi:hypothetical protein
MLDALGVEPEPATRMLLRQAEARLASEFDETAPANSAARTGTSQ